MRALDEKGDVKKWNGFGTEGAEGLWAGILGWESVEVCISVWIIGRNETNVL